MDTFTNRDFVNITISRDSMMMPNTEGRFIMPNHKEDARAIKEWCSQFLRQPGFYVTFEIVSPESAELGEPDQRGWVDSGGWHLDVDDKPVEPYASFDCDFDFNPDTHETVSAAIVDWAVEFLYDIGSLECAGDWWTDADDEMDPASGNVEKRSYHPEGFTDDELQQIAQRVP